MMVWGSKIIYFGLLSHFCMNMFFKNAGKTVVKGGNFTLLNADWGAIIIGCGRGRGRGRVLPNLNKNVSRPP